MPDLYAASLARSYGFNDDARLSADLDDASTAFAVVEVCRWEDLRLSVDGSLPDGSRFTQQGLEQVCNDLAPGLFRLMLDLSGSDRGPDDVDREFSQSDATSIYNLALRRRFETRFRESRRLVKDMRAGVVDGTVPASTLVVDNRDFMARLRSEIDLLGRDVLMAEACLAGSRLTVRYVDRRGLARAPDGSVWHSGFWVQNNQSAGDAAASASVLLHDPTSGDSAIGPSLRLRKASRRGRSRVEQDREVVYSAVVSAVDAGRVRDAFEAMGGCVLIPGGRRPDVKARVDDLVEKLTKKGMPRRSARDVVLSARMGGVSSESPSALPFHESVDVSGYSLYKAICSLAKSRHAGLRERLERVAFDLLQTKKGKRST